MASVSFYAVDDDRFEVLRAVFQDQSLRVFEDYSVPDQELREFVDADEAWQFVRGEFPNNISVGLSLLPTTATSSGFTVERFDLRSAGASFRSQTRGWGLIHLHLCGIKDRRLRQSFANHNSEKRALAFCDVYSSFPGPQHWDWGEVNRSARRVTNRIRRLGTSKIGSAVVLPRAHAAFEEKRLTPL